MASIKLVTLALYGVLAYLGITQPLTFAANLSIAALALLGIVHVAECRLYRRLIREAPGSSAWHTINVLLFGVFHMVVMRRAIMTDYEPSA